MRSRDQAFGIKFAHDLAQFAEILEWNMPRVADVSLITEVQIPIAKRTQALHQRANRAFVFFIFLQTRSSADSILARQRQVHDHTASITVANQRFEFRQKGLARSAVRLYRGDVVRES